ncbi:hypothetical protein [Rhizobium sp. BK399]|uniref:hypothetical protein n=1 Tax=Rhizobium sp. BK399 TaxID=2587063 RepID=UPI00160FB978|nr:hypothetical protein [Rhizobium sp. BK399]MBB3544113.1 hypothetical protein [Rhizobium sp. BK399]
MNLTEHTLIHDKRIDDKKSPLLSDDCEEDPYKNIETSVITRQQRHKVQIIDRPCGTGKTTEILGSFKQGERYLVVVPLLSEVERVILRAVVNFVQPTPGGENDTKSEHLITLLREGVNVVTTHKLFTEIASAASLGLLDDYHIIIDEVLDVVKGVVGKSARSFDQFYIDDGYATEDDDGLITPTVKWDEHYREVSDTLDPRLYNLAKSQTLYRVDGSFFLRALPAPLLQSGRSFTVYTYMAEGSLMLAYLRKIGIDFHHERSADEDTFRNNARRLIDVRTIPAIEGQPLSYSGQTRSKGRTRRNESISIALKNTKQRSLKGVDMNDVIITCAKENWFKSGTSNKAAAFACGSRMVDANWLPNTTRGTNDFAHASVCIYLYDQYINPFIRRWLGMENAAEADDRYALAELIQWVYRSRVRRGEPITLYLPSKRMRRLLHDWLEGGAIASDFETLSLAA